MSKSILRICLAQLNFSVGDLNGNTKKILKAIKDAQNNRADIIVFPELAVSGYPPEDLLLRPRFVEENMKKINEIVNNTGDIVAIIGFVDCPGDCLYNAAAIINNKKLIQVYHKNCLPNYGVFDEARYFRAGKGMALMNIKNVPVGITICEDIWAEKGPAQRLARAGGRLLVNINASPFHLGKSLHRRELVSSKAADNNLFIVYNNLVGGQDELVFDGGSFIVSEKGTVICSLPQFSEETACFDLTIDGLREWESSLRLPGAIEEQELTYRQAPVLDQEEEVYEALKTGLKDYAIKNGFNKVAIGLSGGIDSALTAAIAVDALGNENVTALFMPSEYTSEQSYLGAKEFSKNLGLDLISIPITDLYHSYLNALAKTFKGTQENIAEQNIQARIRGNLLMALSNKYGHLVLATGNKSELSVGYSTLYGDMAGGFAVLKDVYKTFVYKLAGYRNREKMVIPEFIIKRPPSAELRPNQFDTDVLPPYDILDPILKAYIEDDESPAEIAKSGYDRKTVDKVVSMVDKNEYKRRQAAPGIKITPKAFGKDRRMPITNLGTWQD